MTTESVTQHASLSARPPLAVLVLMSMLGPLAMNIFLPSMLGIQRYFETDFASVQLGLSLFLASLALAQLVLGTLSDRFGRRPVLLAGLCLFIVGTFACIFAPNIHAFLAGRVVQGFGGSAGLILSRAIVRDLYDRDEAASMIGYVTMGMAVAPMIGPAIAGYLDRYLGWQSSFYLLACFGFIVLITSYRKVTETNVTPTDSIDVSNVYRSYRTLMSIRLFWLYTGVAGFASGMFFSFLGGAPFVSEKVLGLTPDRYGLFFILVALGYSTGNFLSGRYAARLGVFKMIMLGNLLGLVSVAAMIGWFLVGDAMPLKLFGPMFFLSIANGLVLPSSMAGTVSVRPELAGSAAGLSGSFQMLFGATLSYFVGIILPMSVIPTAWPLIIAMTVSLILAFMVGSYLWTFRTKA
ncbi:MAG: multidrug effflux MFS transporter [Hyphomicrobiales bacterium]